MTLYDVRSLAKKGDRLVLDYIKGFSGINLSSGYNQPRYINVDIRYDDIDEFLMSRADAQTGSCVYLATENM